MRHQVGRRTFLPIFTVKSRPPKSRLMVSLAAGARFRFNFAAFKRRVRNRSGHPGCAGGAPPRGGDRSPTPQPPTSSTVVDPDGLYQTRW